jgi:hypothetical protein
MRKEYSTVLVWKLLASCKQEKENNRVLHVLMGGLSKPLVTIVANLKLKILLSIMGGEV